MNFRVTRDGHVECLLNQEWQRPTKQHLKAMTSSDRSSYGALVESTLQGTEKPFSH